MIVDQPDRLHERIADRRAHEGEAAPAEIAAERVGFHRAGGNPGEGAPSVLPRRAADERPDVALEAAELALDREERPRIADRAGDLESVADDAVVGEQRRQTTRVV